MSTGKTVSATTCVLLRKTEVTYGVDVGPVETDAIKVRNMVLTPQWTFIDKPKVSHAHPSMGKDVGSFSWKLEFEVDAVNAAPDPTDLPEPRYAPFLKACGMEVTSDATPVTEHVYAYKTRAAAASLTIYVVYFDQDSESHDLYKLTGARGTFTHSGGVDEPVVFKFAFEGLAVTGIKPVTGSLTLASIDYGACDEQDDGVNGKAMTATYSGLSLPTKTYELTPNRRITKQMAVTGVNGIAKILLGADQNTSHELKADPPLELVANYDQWAQVIAATKAALVLQVDSALGTRLTINAPAAQRGEFSPSADEELVRLDNTFYLADNCPTVDSALTITFTRTP